MVSFFVFKDKFHVPSNMDMKILQNEDLCYFQNSGIDQCCHISIFNFSFSIDGLSLYVLHGDFMFSVILQRSLLTILHTHLKKKKKKDVDFVSGRPGFQIPTPSFLGLMSV